MTNNKYNSLRESKISLLLCFLEGRFLSNQHQNFNTVIKNSWFLTIQKYSGLTCMHATLVISELYWIILDVNLLKSGRWRTKVFHFHLSLYALLFFFLFNGKDLVFKAQARHVLNSFCPFPSMTWVKVIAQTQRPKPISHSAILVLLSLNIIIWKQPNR